MKPQRKLAETQTPDGARLALYEHDGSYAIRMNGHGLMDSLAITSELMLGELGTAHVADNPGARILIGGLGLGFTLKSVLAALSATAHVQVVELIPAIVHWNRDYLQSLNGALLEDPRAEILIEDVFKVINRAGPASYDAILLDIDNGPSPMVQTRNARIYNASGLRMLKSTLRSGGRAIIWSAGEHPGFAAKLSQTGFTVNTVRARRRPGARQKSIFLYVADVDSQTSPA